MNLALSSPTLIGSLAVLVWGISLPLLKHVQSNLGILYTIGLLYFLYAAFGLYNQRKSLSSLKQVFHRKEFIFRWLGFVVHEGLGLCAVGLVQPNKVPLTILIHYLWPTAVIFCSILIANVKVTRHWAVLLGSLIVISSLAIEILGDTQSLLSETTNRDYFAFCLSFIGAISWGVYSAVTKKFPETSGGSAALPIFQLTLAALLPISFLAGQEFVPALAPHLTLFIYCIFGCAGFYAWDYGMRHGNVIILSLFADFIPWLSLLGAGIFLSVEITTRTIISAMILVAGAMVTRYGTMGKVDNQKSHK